MAALMLRRHLVANARSVGQHCRRRPDVRMFAVAPDAKAPDAKAPSNNLTKEKMIATLSADFDISKSTATKILNTFLDTIVENVAAGNKVTFPGFGSFDSRSRTARKGRNPKTGETIDIPAKVVPTFSAGTNFKSIVLANMKPATPAPPATTATTPPAATAASGRKNTKGAPGAKAK